MKAYPSSIQSGGEKLSKAQSVDVFTTLHKFVWPKEPMGDKNIKNASNRYLMSWKSWQKLETSDCYKTIRHSLAHVHQTLSDHRDFVDDMRGKYNNTARSARRDAENAHRYAEEARHDVKEIKEAQESLLVLLKKAHEDAEQVRKDAKEDQDRFLDLLAKTQQEATYARQEAREARQDAREARQDARDALQDAREARQNAKDAQENFLKVLAKSQEAFLVQLNALANK